MPRRRTLERQVNINSIDSEPEHVHRERSGNFYCEMEGRELDQGVKTGVPLHTERIEAEEVFRMRSELHGIRRDREISVAPDSRERLVDDVHLDAIGNWKRQRRGIELRMESSDRDDKVGVRPIRHEHSHLTFDGDEENVRVVERGEKIEALLVEFESSREVYLQHENTDVIGGKGELQNSEDGNIARRDFDDDA